MLCGDVWDKVYGNDQYENWFFSILEEHITAGRISNVAPQVAQALVSFHEKQHTLEQLESLLPSLNVSCLDLHQLLSACKKHGLYTITLWLNATALHDYAGPLTELLPILEEGNPRLGNAILVYISCCLAGRAYPRGELPIELATQAKNEVMCYLLSKPCGVLKALMKHDPHACCSVFELAFIEFDFHGDHGELRKQNIVKLLMDLAGSLEERNAVMGLLCRAILSGSIQKTEEFVDCIITWLKEPDGPVKEQIWLDLLAGNVLTKLTNQEIIEIATLTNCFRVKELILERSQEYNQIVECYLSSAHRKAEVFNYIRKHSQTPYREIRTQLLDNFEQLLEISKAETFEIVAELYPELVVPLSERLVYQTDVIVQLLWAAVKKNAPLSVHLANYAQEAGDYELSARILELGGDLAGALELLLSRGAGTQAAALCFRAPEPETLLGTVSDPKLLSRLLKATLSNCAYETLLYEMTFKLLSSDLHTRKYFKTPGVGSDHNMSSWKIFEVS